MNPSAILDIIYDSNPLDVVQMCSDNSHVNNVCKDNESDIADHFIKRYDIQQYTFADQASNVEYFKMYIKILQWKNQRTLKKRMDMLTMSTVFSKYFRQRGTSSKWKFNFHEIYYNIYLVN